MKMQAVYIMRYLESLDSLAVYIMRYLESLDSLFLQFQIRELPGYYLGCTWYKSMLKNPVVALLALFNSSEGPNLYIWWAICSAIHQFGV